MRSRLSFIALLVIAVGATSVAAQTVYWDIDPFDRAGAGATNPTGIWNSSILNWNANADGTGLPAPWVPGAVAAFAAGSNATGTYSVTVNGTMSLSGLIVEEGNVTQNFGTLNFGSTIGAPINVASGSNWGESSSGSITGTGGITKVGGGTLYLWGANTFSRSGTGNEQFLTINAGTVDFQTDANLGAVPSATDNGAALTLNGGTLRYSGSSALTLAKTRGVKIGASGGTIEVTNGTTLALASGASATAAFTGSGTLTKTGAGRFRLQTAQTTFTGKYALKAGSLAFTDQTQFGAIPASTQADYFTLDGGGILNDSGNEVTIDAKRGITLGSNGGSLYVSASGLTYDGIISGTQGGGLLVATDDGLGSSTSGTLTLNSANTYNGRTWIATGATLSVGLLANGGVNSAIGSSSSAATNLVFDGGTLLYRGDATSTNRNLTLTTSGGYIDASGANNAPLVFTSTAAIGLSGTGTRIFILRGTSTGDNTMSLAITDQGTNPTTLNKIDAGTWVLTNTANSYTGNTIISTGGRLKLGASGVIPDGSLVQMFSSAVLDLNGFNETVRSISGSSGTIALGTKTLTIADPNGDSYTAAITGVGGGSLVKNGINKLILSPSTATYDGGVVLNGGSLGIGNNIALGTGRLWVNNIPTLAAASSTAISPTNSVFLNGNLTFNDAFTATPGAITWGTSGTNKWMIMGGARTITVNTAAGGYGVTINQTIGQDAAGRGLSKEGNGTLTLGAANTYTGDTKVFAGTLSLTHTYLADWAAVFLATGSKLNLNFGAGVTDTVAAFFIDGVLQPYGTWGAIGSGAEHESALFTGSGQLLVKNWVMPMAGDFNNDGKIDNGDYLTWRKAFGSNNPLPNDNGLGTPIGQAHLNLWRQQFGNVSGAGSGGGLGSGTIPEPTTGLLIALGMAAFSLFGLRRARTAAK